MIMVNAAATLWVISNLPTLQLRPMSHLRFCHSTFNIQTNQTSMAYTDATNQKHTIKKERNYQKIVTTNDALQFAKPSV